MTDVLLATSRDVPPQLAESPALETEFARLGVGARWAVWDDPGVDWAAAPLVLLRTTWDYADRRAEFLSWAERVAARTSLLNPPRMLRWNTHKGYLIDLERAGVATVPTRVLPPGSSVSVDAPSVVKPAVGVGGHGLSVLAPGAVASADGREMVLQPLVESVRTDGEISVFVFADEAVAAVAKHPAAGEVRVHESYGGSARAVELSAELGSAARNAVSGAADVVGSAPAYARVDMVRLADGGWAVSELELVEPGLYLAVVPHVAEAFARALAPLAGGVTR